MIYQIDRNIFFTNIVIIHHINGNIFSFFLLNSFYFTTKFGEFHLDERVFKSKDATVYPAFTERT